MLEQLMQGALQKALTKAVSAQVDRVVARGVRQANREQKRAEAFLSGWYVGLQMTYAGGFLCVALLLCVALGLLLGETQVLAYFLPIIALMLALICWTRSRMYRVLYWPGVLLLETRKGETAAEFLFSQVERIRVRKGKLTVWVSGKRIALTCHPLENRPAYDRLVALLRQTDPEKFQD